MDDPVTVVRADSATWNVPRMDGHRLSQVHGQWGAETQLTRTELPYGETVLSSRRGTTSHHANPWVMLDDGTATEEHGRVHSCALAWSGSWQLTVQRLPTERVAVSAGAGHSPITTQLLPGAELRTPVSAAAYTEGGFGGTSRAWHRYLLDHVLPHPGELRPVLYNSWEATEFEVSVEGQSALAERAAALGVELFVMDDGWFGARTHDAAGLGDWTPNPERFPDGLTPLINRVHELGMRFGLWVEPEMVNPDSDLYRAHPDWVLHHPTRRRTEARNQLVLNLARPDVAAWMYDRLDELLTKNDIDFLKWDFNRPFTEAGWPDAEGDPDALWADHVHHLYAVIDPAPGRPPAPAHRVLRQRRCPARPRHPRPHRPGVDVRQHRRPRPSRLPLPRRHGRCPGRRRRSHPLERGRTRPRRRAGGRVQARPATGAAGPAVPVAGPGRR